jgi:hypothetical protein
MPRLRSGCDARHLVFAVHDPPSFLVGYMRRFFGLSRDRGQDTFYIEWLHLEDIFLEVKLQVYADGLGVLIITFVPWRFPGWKKRVLY